MANSDVKKIIRQLKKKEIGIDDIPEEYENNIEIVYFERNAGNRITQKRGFDVISNLFFVKEILAYVDNKGEEKERLVYLQFEDFTSYYEFLNGDIYNDACYTFCHLSDITNSPYEIDLERLMAKTSFINDTIDDYSFEITSEEKEEFQKGKENHRLCKQWIKRFDECQNYEDFVKLANNYKKSRLSSELDISFFLFKYILEDIGDMRRFAIIMEFLSSGDYMRISKNIKYYPPRKMLRALCFIYDPDEVVNSFRFSAGSKNTVYKHRNKLKDYVSRLKNGELSCASNGYFDKITHYYCDETQVYINDMSYSATELFRYFETFDEFVEYRKGDLRNCDLSGAFDCKADFSNYITDETTKLPPNRSTNMMHCVKKYYHCNGFYVSQQWLNESGVLMKECRHSFGYFFDFVAFLKGDLSGADLLFCDGLINLDRWDGINFKGALLKSSLCKKFGLSYETLNIDRNLIKSFDNVENNEIKTDLVLQTTRDLESTASQMDLSVAEIHFNSKCQKVYYVSDLHLMHKIQNAGCHTKEDVIYVVQKIVDLITEDINDLLLIDGDVSSDFEVFQLFVKILSENIRENTLVIFTLGNHELWDFQGTSMEQIVSKYRAVVEKYNMYLLHNDLLYREEHGYFTSPKTSTHLLKYHDLCQMTETQISSLLHRARFVVLGGLGFSGYNTEFNANNGIYRDTMDRNAEIRETSVFEDLYNRLRPILPSQNTVILTHTPKNDWCQDANPDKGFVYVSGHTHRNFFYDDGEYRVYSDNQVGYHNCNPHLKFFLIDNEYDIFADYPDGIYEITKEQYSNFYRGKNIQVTFHRKINVLYMLKKHGYYCFIHKSMTGGLTILNGGSLKKLKVQNVHYYYDNMDAVISKLKNPIEKYTSLQNSVAKIIRKIGGRGRIHGCIVDIDFCNHIYVNPFDQTVTGYRASNIFDKLVYPSVPSLLKENCPEFYDKYIGLLDQKEKDLLMVSHQTDVALLPQPYLNTDIYSASREIAKLQKLNSNILTSWYDGENAYANLMLTDNTKK